MMSYRYKEHLFFLKEVTQLPQHSSPRFTLGALCNFILYTLFFFQPIISRSFAAVFCRSGPSLHSWVLCDPLSSGAPWKPCASWQKCTSAQQQGRILPPAKKGPKHLELFFFPAARHWHGKAQASVCVTETSAFYRLEETRVTEWQTSLLTVSCVELRVPQSKRHAGSLGSFTHRFQEVCCLEYLEISILYIAFSFL